MERTLAALRTRGRLDAPTASILIVDDRPANLLALEAILEPTGHRLVRAASGEQALTCVKEEDFAVILMDVRMPGMDGLRTLEFIKEREASARIPVILLTAVNLGNSDVAGAYARGAVDFLLKPFDPDILRSKVMVFVDLFLKEQKIKHQAALLLERDREAFERRSEQRFRSLVDALPQCVWVARPDLEITYSNQQAVEYIGLRAEQALPRARLLDFVHPEDRSRIQLEWHAATGSDEVVESRARLLRNPDAAGRWCLVRRVPQRDDSERLTGWIIAAADIDSEHHALEEAQAANRAKENFLAVVSHELRNPLNAIKGWVQLLRSGKLQQDQQIKAFDTIERNIELQTALIGDVLDLASIERGQFHLEKRPLEMRVVVEAALAAVRPGADSKGVVLEFSDAAPGGAVLGDADRLQQVMWNLLSNSLKFTPREGRIAVAMRQQDARLIVTVQDTGQGIDKEFLPHLFEAFRQNGSATTRQHGGLGLGLAIVRSIVELHGGRVEAESDGPDTGACFRIFLPLHAQQSEGVPLKTNWEEDCLLDHLSLLVVDDDPDSRESLAEILKLRGAAVRTAASAREALEIIAAAPPTVLLSDIAMPQQDGNQLIRAIRGTIPAGQMPAIAVSGMGEATDRIRALNAGFQTFLVKPYSTRQLIEAIMTLAKRPPP